MKCERHGLGADKAGKCVLCARERAAFGRAVSRQSDRRTRRVVSLAVGILAGVAAFALLLGVCDRGREGAEADAGTETGAR